MVTTKRITDTKLFVTKLAVKGARNFHLMFRVNRLEDSENCGSLASFCAKRLKPHHFVPGEKNKSSLHITNRYTRRSRGGIALRDPGCVRTGIAAQRYGSCENQRTAAERIQQDDNP